MNFIQDLMRAPVDCVASHSRKRKKIEALLSANDRKQEKAENIYRLYLEGTILSTNELKEKIGKKNIPTMLKSLEERGLVHQAGTRQNPTGGRPLQLWTWVGE